MKYLSVEFTKLTRPANYIMLAIFFALFSALVVMGFFIRAKLAAEGNHGSVNTTLPLGLELVEGMTNLAVHTILVIFIIINIGKEYSENTLRRSVISGLTRKEFYASKVLIVIVATLFFFFVQRVLIVGGAYLWHVSDLVPAYLTVTAMVRSLGQIFVVSIISFFLVFLTRSISMSIIIFFVWSAIIEPTLLQFQGLIFGGNVNLKEYLPVSCMSYVIAFLRHVPVHSIILASCYAAVMLVAPYVLFMKRDIR